MMPFYGCHLRTSDSTLRHLAAAVLADALSVLQKPRPARKASWPAYEFDRDREIAFFRDPSKSAKWCEVAGFDWAAVVSKLEHAGLLGPEGKPVARRGPVGPYNTRAVGIGRVETTLPRDKDKALTAAELAAKLGVSSSYVSRALVTLHAKHRVLKAGQVYAARASKPTTLWYRRAA